MGQYIKSLTNLSEGRKKNLSNDGKCHYNGPDQAAQRKRKIEAGECGMNVEEETSSNSNGMERGGAAG